MGTVLRGALLVGIIWLYTNLLTYKCIHYAEKLNRITTKMKPINIIAFIKKVNHKEAKKETELLGHLRNQ